MECHLFGDGASNPPHGVAGGTPGIGGGTYKENRTTGKRIYCSAKGHLVIGEDEVWVGASTGGGGHGDPLERDPGRVRDDARHGLISNETARDVYGVVFDTATYAVDEAATAALRREIARTRGEPEVVTPNEPAAGQWLSRHLREGDEYLLDPQ
jgi:N-methylhydantoinase B